MTKRNCFRIILICAALFFAIDEFRCDNISRVLLFLGVAISAGIGIYTDWREKKDKEKS